MKVIYRVICLAALAAVILSAVPAAAASGTLVAEPVDLSSDRYEVGADSVYIQSFEEWTGGEFSGKADEFDVVKEYIDFLVSGGMNLKSAGSNDLKYYSDKISSAWVFDYTGNVEVNGTFKLENSSIASRSHDVSIYVMRESGSMSFDMQVAPPLKMADLGYRKGSAERKTVTPPGESSQSGLYRFADGSFETSDGKLKTNCGETVVRKNGVLSAADAEYSFAENANMLIEIKNYSGQDGILLTLPHNSVEGGEIYSCPDLRQSKESADPETENGTQVFFKSDDGVWRRPLTVGGYVRDVCLRIMYYNPDDAIVFYIGAEMTDGTVVEALCAEDMQAETPYTVTGIECSGGNTVKVSYVKKNGAPEKAVLYAVSYSDFGAGAVKDIKSAKIDGSGLQSLSFGAAPTGAIKAFIWEDSSALKPLSNVKRVGNSAYDINSYPESSRKTLLAPDPPNINKYDISRDTLYYQSFAGYQNDNMVCGESSDNDTYYSRGFSGSDEDVKIFESYVEMLCSADSKFTVADEYEFSTGFDYGCHEYLLKYNGTQTVNGDLGFAIGESEKKGDILIYYTLDYDTFKVSIRVAKPLEAVDAGIRYGSEKFDGKAAGPSLYSGLIQMPDGRYATGDGRFSVSKGEASILRGGEYAADDTNYYITINDLYTEDDCELMEIVDFVKDDDLTFKFAVNGLKTGDIYTLDNQVVQTGAELGTGEYVGTQCVTASINGSEQISFANTRVMYYKPNDTAVFYFYIDTGRTPEIIEGLAAVDLDVEPDTVLRIILETQGGGLRCAFDKDSFNGVCKYCENGYTPDGRECQICNGTSVCVACGGDGYYVDELPGGGGQIPEEDKGRECYICGGSGRCGKCGGSGKRDVYGFDRPQPCMYCNGTGKCRSCGGDGILYN